MTFTDEVHPEFATWEDLATHLMCHRFDGWVFRGLSCYEHSPVSSLERTLKACGEDVCNWPYLERRAVAYFQERSRHCLESFPAEDDLILWLALMQHYGAPTRLVDWTVSPLVACYFALECAREEDGAAALWMLNAAACRRVLRGPRGVPSRHLDVVPSRLPLGADQAFSLAEAAPGGRDRSTDGIALRGNALLRRMIGLQSDWPVPLVILRPDKRMVAQRACFVASGKIGGSQTAIEHLMQPITSQELTDRLAGLLPDSDEEGVRAGAPHCGWDAALVDQFRVPGRVVKKVHLPWAWRDEVLASLARMNVTAETLFPGLDGIGRSTSQYLRTGEPISLREYLNL